MTKREAEYLARTVRLIKDIADDQELTDKQKIRLIGMIF